MKQTIPIFFILSFSILLDARPKNIPENAYYNSEIKSFVLVERFGKKEKKTMWDKEGELAFVSWIDGDFRESTFYNRGRWSSRQKYHIHKLTKRDYLPPDFKPKEIPEKATFNFDFSKWEIGETTWFKKNGTWKLYWPTDEYGGTIEYKNGVYEGYLRTIWENGKPYETVKYSNGKREGEYKAYYDNGKLLDLSYYKNGVYHGTRTLFNMEGKLKEKIEVKDGAAKHEYFNETKEEKEERLEWEKRMAESRARRNIKKSANP
ncbi:toxin-antitoxin system YwqK family antitoxin [Leptospira sp. 'Mane']|uniref:toxin-antitoxin system YwqK family antitoxin n=1 Tax=Leptospira sp. 'Mane' TaxID=3387407 RepID=UPI00398AF215